MLKLTKTNTLSAVALAMAVIATPSLAAANSYSNGYHGSAYEACKRSDTENQVLGGVIGAVTGGVLGSQVAGNGARSEGSALGAVIGAVAGSQIANKDCKSRRGYVSESYHAPTQLGYPTRAPIVQAPVYSSSRTVYTSPRVSTVHYPVSRPNYRGHSQNYGYSRGNQVASIQREINDLRRKRDNLERRNRYEQSYRLDRRIERIGHRIGELKRQKRFAKKNRGYNSRHYGGY